MMIPIWVLAGVAVFMRILISSLSFFIISRLMRMQSVYVVLVSRLRMLNVTTTINMYNKFGHNNFWVKWKVNLRENPLGQTGSRISIHPPFYHNISAQSTVRRLYMWKKAISLKWNNIMMPNMLDFESRNMKSNLVDILIK